jgi:predicted LPLAT superfamily acyltransferase
MRHLFYRLMTIAGKIFGDWFFVLLSRCVAAGYFMLFPKRVAVGVRFYRALFPHRGHLYHLWCTFRQFQNFTSVFLDRIMLQGGRKIPFHFQGREHLIEAMQNKSGGIILMSHIGNWEIAAHLLHQSLRDLPLMLYMGQRARDAIERTQKNDLQAKGIRVVAVDQDGASPFDLVEGITFLRQGGFLSMAGDMVWHQNQRTIEVDFLRHRIRLPDTPHALALLSGAPLFIFFAAIKAGHQYHFRVRGPFYVRADERARRTQALQESAQHYAGLMEEHLRTTPFEWYHFEPLLT